MAERRQRLGPQLARASQRAARPQPHPPPHQPQRYLPRKQFIIGQALARLRQRRRPFRILPGLQAFSKAGPSLAFQQGRLVPFRKIH